MEKILFEWCQTRQGVVLDKIRSGVRQDKEWLMDCLIRYALVL